MTVENKADLLARLDTLTPQELKRYLAQELTRKKLGLVWETDLIERDQAINANIVLPVLSPDISEISADAPGVTPNLVIEGDNFDALRLLRATHTGKVRVTLIDIPYGTGNKDWVYNDSFQSKNDRWRYSTWLEFMYQRLILARDLMTPDGVLMVCINDENRSKLELMMDEVLPGRRLGSMVWRTRQGSNANQGCFLSSDHEHILVYGNPGFTFNGLEKDYSMYKNPDNDPRGDWQSGDLCLGFSYRERPNLYYPLVDTETGIHYPPNPDNIWRFATESKIKPGQRLQTKSMEQFIREKQILFPAEQEVRTWNSMDELLSAIKAGDVPKAGNAFCLRENLPNLEYWVGKPVGFGRPRFKRFKADLKNANQPLSSWIASTTDGDKYDAPGSIVSTTNLESARNISAIFGDKVFNYAKPLTLFRELLAQATRPDKGDIVLDFFAGSGTTAHAVMELNAQDGGNRSFIMCSSTEATAKEPDKNLCRDVCAERIRKVIQGYGKAPGLGGEFAYLTMDLVEEADLLLDATKEHAYNILCMRYGGGVRPVDSTAPVWPVAIGDHAAVVVCTQVNDEAVQALKAIEVNRLIAYTDRPGALAATLEDAGVQAVCRSLNDALTSGQLAPGGVSASTEVQP